LNTIVYLHGFASSPKSTKARLLGEFLARRAPEVEYLVPALDARPAQAISQVLWHCLGKAPETLTLMGSSLGGFYAIAAAEKLGCRAVLLNPVVRAHEALASQLGRRENLYTGESFELTRAHLDELRALAVAAVTRPERYWLIAEKGDELLDWREMAAFFAGGRQTIAEGGSHALDSFAEHLEGIAAFAGATSGAHA
jgi:predicted esterase YcpF (UPF0227 family)